MSIQNPNQIPNQTFNNPYTTPQSYVNINTATPTYPYNQSVQGVFTKFVSSEKEANTNLPTPQSGCVFGVDGENMVFYAKYADGRMEVYDMVLREPPKQPEPLTADSLSELLDRKFTDFESTLSKKFVLRKENNPNRGGN